MKGGHARRGGASTRRKNVADGDVANERGIDASLGVDGAEDAREDLLWARVLESTLLRLGTSRQWDWLISLDVRAAYLCDCRADGGDNDDVIVVLCECARLGREGGEILDALRDGGHGGRRASVRGGREGWRGESEGEGSGTDAGFKADRRASFGDDVSGRSLGRPDPCEFYPAPATSARPSPHSPLTESGRPRRNHTRSHFPVRLTATG